MLFPPVASRQLGVFTRRQARAAGFSAKVIARRCADGVWDELMPGAFCAIGTPPTLEVRATAATLVTGGVASHETAAELHGLEGGGLRRRSPGAAVDVIMRRRVHAVVPGVREHRLLLAEHEVELIRGIPITSRARTVLDLIVVRKPEPAATLMFRGLQQGWITAPSLASAIERRAGMHGTPMLRALHELTGTDAHSVAERALHDVLEAMPGLRWRANAGVHVAGRRFVVDVLLEPGIALELDGYRFHTTTDQFQRDRERQNALVAAGFVVLRFTWLDVTLRADHVREVVAQNLRSRSRP